ncbi:hypothetical protein RvY_02573 [Ramazzottius varieornatus]|uniref:Chitin-binding type-2 domain-containing protein n=1 Tax=Ramazzottius varieornatus TaxID=947166 RepID=A0A1D1UK69_RAMVA|nr:hypothetical protein RvY_02573 [Ramazzottius varieornatus]
MIFAIWLVLAFCGGKVLSTYCVPKSSPYDPANLDTYPLGIQNPPTYQTTTAALIDTSVQAVKDYIVDKHNCLRTLITPTAANMLEMVWNNEVAAGAQQHADNCVFAHNSPSNRSTSQWSMGGQNLFQNGGTIPMTWRNAIDAWFNEVYSCTDGTATSCTTGAVIGHYTQVAWAKSWQIGCGARICAGTVLFVCNYNPLGNYNQPIEPVYQTGPPCGACPSYCKEGKLCTNHCNYFDAYTNCPTLTAGPGGCTLGTGPNAANCAATCKCGRNDGLTDFPDTTTAPPTTTPLPTSTTPPPTSTTPPPTSTTPPPTSTTPPPTSTTPPPTSTTPPPTSTTPPPTSTTPPPTSTTPPPTSTTPPPTSTTPPPTSTTSPPTSTTPPPTSAPCLSQSTTGAPTGSGRPNCYNRCDATFCADKGTGITYHEISPCSRNYCRCSNMVPTYLSCASGKYFDGSVPLGPQTCHVGNATWCPPSGGLSGPPPLTSAQVAPFCNAANCAARNGQNTYYALDCCSRQWCYCYPNGTQVVQTCPSGMYFDHRSEWSQCRNSTSLEFCPTTFTTTTAAVPPTCATAAPSSTTVAPVPSTTPPVTSSSTPINTPPAPTPPPTVTTTPQPTSTSPTPTPNVRPQCYSRCDATFCSGKAPKYYAPVPCSRNLCYCNSTVSLMYGCGTGQYFDETSQTCRTPSASFCPSTGNPSAPAPQLLSAVQGMCSAQNCADRLGANTFYPLECCSPYWCYCYANGTRTIQTCPSGYYFDFRPEWVQCRPIANFEFCAQ